MVFDVGTGVRGVVRVPDPEDVAGEQGSRAGQLGEGVQCAGVVVPVGEQVAVLDVPAACSGAGPIPVVVQVALWVSSSNRHPARSSRPSVCSGSRRSGTWPRRCPAAQGCAGS